MLFILQVSILSEQKKKKKKEKKKKKRFFFGGGWGGGGAENQLGVKGLSFWNLINMDSETLTCC